MATKLNIFNALPNAPSDDEDNGSGHKTQAKGSDKAKKDRIRKKVPRQDNAPEPKTTGKETHGLQKDFKSRDHHLKKVGNDLDHPHTLNRKSGTGEQAFGRHDKKGGAGRFNKGTFKDDFRGPRPEGETAEREGEQSPQEEEEDNTVTFDDYVSKSTTAEAKQQINDVKTKITDDQLKKELGKATLLQTRKDNKVDDIAETYKKDKHAPIVGMNTEYADLLGFRTGFKTFDNSKRRPQGERGGEKPAEQKEGETGAVAEQTEEKKQEGGDDKKPEEQSPSGQKGEHKGYRKHGEGERGGYRGGYKGENRGGYKGDNRGGYKGDNKGDNRGGYKGDNRGGQKGGQKVAFNAEDESLFPKLG